jgi:TPP-dependent pyruvate/acetoin dehydrogenase alpha subunit
MNKMSNNPFPLSKEKLLEAYRIMRTIREFEDRLHVDFARGDIPGFVHLYAGEEASAAGIMLHLNDRDRIASTHRGHGHCIAKGVDVKEMMAEIYGKITGSCRGKPTMRKTKVQSIILPKRLQVSCAMRNGRAKAIRSSSFTGLEAIWTIGYSTSTP